MNVLMTPVFYPCDKIPGFAYDYLENRLPPVTALRFRMHLRLCKGCNEFVRLYRMAADPVQFLDETPVPPELVEYTLAFLDRELESQKDGTIP
jgi:hypothetical protein